MKLCLPFFFVALLGVGIMPVAAVGPRSFSDGANPDSGEAAPESAPDPSSINPSKEDDRTQSQWWAMASAIEPQKTIEEKPSSESEELEVKVPVENNDQKPNSDLTFVPKPDGDRPNPIPNIEPTAPAKEPTAAIPKLDEIARPNTSVESLLNPSRPSLTNFSDVVQISQSVVQVTGVRLNPTQAGLEVILETAEGQVLQAKTRTEGKTLIADIANAQLALPDGQEFRAQNPFEGINLVTVTQVDGNSIRINITGQENLPTAGVLRSASGLVLSVSTEKINIIVTGNQQTPYLQPNASTATRTDTPIRDIPQSIQVIPQEVIEDQQVIRAEDALNNVSGVTFSGGSEGQGLNVVIRGFTGSPVLVDGFRDYASVGGSDLFPDTAIIERIEVLKGPASILFGQIEPGGIVNVVTKQPLSNPFYEAEVQLGNYGFARPRIDISGPLTSDGSLLYRLNAVYEHSEGFRDFEQDIDRVLVAPVVTWKISDRTDFTVLLQYSDIQQPIDFGRIAAGDKLLDTPRNRIFGEPDDYTKIQLLTTGYNFDHRFSNNWTFRNAFRYSDRYMEQRFTSFPSHLMR